MKKFLLLFSALIYGAIGFAQQVTEFDNYFGITPTVEIDGKFYEPFCATYPFSLISTGMKAYYMEGGKLVAIDDDIIPASTQVIIECISDNPANNLLDLNVQDVAALKENDQNSRYFWKPKTAASKYNNLYAMMDDLLAGENGVGNAKQGVYSILGVKLRQDSNTDDLPAGIYIVNGKKIIIR